MTKQTVSLQLQIRSSHTAKIVYVKPINHTSNVTGRHRGSKYKLWAGYSAPSLKRISCCDYFSSSHVVLHAFSALCMYSKFGHYHHLLGYLCAKLHFFCGLRCCASPQTVIVYPLNHSPSLFDAPGTKAYASEHCQKLDFLGYIFVAEIWIWLH